MFANVRCFWWTKTKQEDGAVEINACRCSFYEIYNEQAFDLAVLDDDKVPLNVREASDRGAFLEGLSEEEVRDGSRRVHRGSFE